MLQERTRPETKCSADRTAVCASVDYNREGVNTTMIGSPIYDDIHKDTAATILTLSGLPRSAIDNASTELQVDYEFFCADSSGPYLADAYLGFIAMLQHWGIPCPGVEYSSLNGLTLAPFYLARAWEENDTAKYCFDGQAVAHGWDHDDAIGVGVVAAVSAAKLIAHAKLLMATGDNRIAQEPVE